MVKRVLAVLALALMGSVAASGVAVAGHAVPTVEAEDNGDGTATVTVTQSTETDHKEDLSLVVSDPSGVHVEELGADEIETSVTVGPFNENYTVSYRVFGGGERNYDLPLWNEHPEVSDNTNDEFKNLINEYSNSHGGGWDFTVAGPDDINPFVTWHELEVEVPVSSPTPSPGQTGGPTAPPGDQDKGDSSLPETGLPVALLVGAGAALVVGGGALLKIRRRRKIPGLED